MLRVMREYGEDPDEEDLELMMQTLSEVGGTSGDFKNFVNLMLYKSSSLSPDLVNKSKKQ